jgi:glycosyltransferase involved in cell wall biosynthesis
LRIVMVTARYAPFIGGVEAHVARVARLLVEAGHSVTVLTTDPSGTLPSRHEENGVEIVRVRARPGRGDYFFAPGIARVLRERRWDVVHVQSYHTFVAPIAMLAARRLGIPYVVTFHGGGHSSRLRHAARANQIRALGPLLRDAHRLVAIATFELELYGRLLGVPREAFALIPNGSDLTAGTPPPASPQGAQIASLGRLERYKGHQHAIAALPFVLEQIPDARLWIAGEGPYEGKLRRLARSLGVEDRVEIRAIPLSRRPEYVDGLAKTALAVLLSDFETHPLAIIEAVALGRPALVADTSGLRELAENGYARAVSVGSGPASIAAAMVDELRTPSARPHLTLPTWDACRDRLVELYAECAALVPTAPARAAAVSW